MARTSRWLPLHLGLFGFPLFNHSFTLIVYSFNGQGVGEFPPH